MSSKERALSAQEYRGKRFKKLTKCIVKMIAIARRFERSFKVITAH
jgi:hypothetical protein